MTKRDCDRIYKPHTGQKGLTRACGLSQLHPAKLAVSVRPEELKRREPS